MKRQNDRPINGNAVIASLLTFCILLIFIAFLCASSAKGALDAYRPQGDDPSFPEVTDPAVTFPPFVIGTESTAAPGTDTGDVTGTGTDSSEDPETPPGVIRLRDLYEDERLIGEYNQNGVLLRISKVERGDLNMFICDITLAAPELFRTAFAGGKINGRQYTSKIAESVGAVFAVNGDFCGYRTNGIIIREGVLARDKAADWDLCFLDKNGDFNVGVSNTFNADTLISEGVRQSWCFGPTLVENYMKIENMNRPNLSATAREPRTAIGQAGPLHYYILVVDAVRTGSGTVGGLSFSGLADQFVALGCKVAYNLDGGGSTTLYFNGEVINSPCVNSERAVSDIIFLK